MIELKEIARGRRIVAVAAREFGLTRAAGRPAPMVRNRVIFNLIRRLLR